MGRLQCTVAHWPKADMTVRDSDVRFRGQSGHPLGLADCLLMTRSRQADDCGRLTGFKLLQFRHFWTKATSRSQNHLAR